VGSHYKGTAEELRALNAYINLGRALLSVDGEVNQHLSQFGLTERQFAVLEALYHVGPLFQRDIAKKILCTPGNLTGLLRNLEARGLVSRCEKDGDKRYLQVSLSKKGEELISKILPQHVSRIVERFKVLSEDEIEILRVVCKKLGMG